MTKLEVRMYLSKAVNKFKTKREAAASFDISDTHLNRLLTGEYDFPDHVCAKLGFKKKSLITYQKVKS